MPTRYLKPGICDSEAIDKCTPMAECLFYRLLVNVDDFGRLDARPAVIKARCFPLKELMTAQEIDDLLVVLVRASLIQVYTTVNGSRYLQLLKWDNVPRSKESKFPAFDENCIRLYTDVNDPHTNLPVTVTVTVTETVNRKPGTETETRKKNAHDMLTELGVEDQAAKDWLTIRKAKRAPLTQTALDDLVLEAGKAGITVNEAVSICAKRSWQGFNATWDWKNNGARSGGVDKDQAREGARARLFGEQNATE